MKRLRKAGPFFLENLPEKTKKSSSTQTEICATEDRAQKDILTASKQKHLP